MRKRNILVASLPAISLIVIFQILAHYGTNFPYPGAFLAAVVAYATFSGGARAGILSAALVVTYEVFDFQEPGTVFIYSASNTLRLIAALIFAPLTVVVVCAMRDRVLAVAFKFARGEMQTEAEQLIEQEHFQFTTILEQLPFAVVIVRDASCKISFANREAIKLLGHNVSEFHPYAYHRMYHASGQPYTPDQWPLIRSVKNGEVVEDEQFFYAGPGGHLRPMWGRSTPVRNAKGEVVAAAMVFHDVSDSRRAGMAQMELETVVNSSDDAIVSLSLEAAILTWNPAAERIFGYNREEVHGMHLETLVAVGRREELQLLLEKTRRGERVARFESVMRSKDGGSRPALFRLAPILDATGNACAATLIVREFGAPAAHRREQTAALQR